MGLAEAREGIKQRLQLALCVAAAGHPFEEVGETYEAISDAFQGLGICELLLQMDTHRFRLNLARSAQTRGFFLRKSREKGSTDTIFVALSRTQALFDALACGEAELARQILQYAPNRWMPDGEYEDEYHYHRLVHAIAAAPSAQPNTTVIDYLRSFEQSAADDTANRLSLCQAFLGGGQQDFWESLTELLSEEKANLDSESALEEEFGDEPWNAARKHVSIEGLAWVALAHARGWYPDDVLAMAPSAAFSAFKDPASPGPDVIGQLERDFGL